MTEKKEYKGIPRRTKLIVYACFVPIWIWGAFILAPKLREKAFGNRDTNMIQWMMHKHASSVPSK